MLEKLDGKPHCQIKSDAENVFLRTFRKWLARYKELKDHFGVTFLFRSQISLLAREEESAARKCATNFDGCIRNSEVYNRLPFAVQHELERLIACRKIFLMSQPLADNDSLLFERLDYIKLMKRRLHEYLLNDDYLINTYDLPFNLASTLPMWLDYFVWRKIGFTSLVPQDVISHSIRLYLINWEERSNHQKRKQVEFLRDGLFGDKISHMLLTVIQYRELHSNYDGNINGCFGRNSNELDRFNKDNPRDINVRTENVINVLFQCGFINRKCMPLSSGDNNIFFSFCIPNLGTFIMWLRRGNQQILQQIKRNRFKEVMLHDVCRRQFNRSKLSIDFHILYLVSQAIVERVDVASGTLIRLRQKP